MKNCEISINQLAEFYDATQRRKTTLVEQQIVPNKVLLPWYQLAKAKIKKSIEQQGDLTPINEGISQLLNQQPDKDWKHHNKFVSIEALQRFVSMKLPKVLQNVNYQIIKPEKKIFYIHGVAIKVAPEVIVKVNVNGRAIIGAFKIHIKKKHFSKQQAELVANILYRYLNEEVADKNEEVLPEYCFCLDVFSERIIHANKKDAENLETLKNLCVEVKEIWDSIQISQ